MSISGVTGNVQKHQYWHSASVAHSTTIQSRQHPLAALGGFEGFGAAVESRWAPARLTYYYPACGGSRYEAYWQRQTSSLQLKAASGLNPRLGLLVLVPHALHPDARNVASSQARLTPACTRLGLWFWEAVFLSSFEKHVSISISLSQNMFRQQIICAFCQAPATLCRRGRRPAVQS